MRKHWVKAAIFAILLTTAALSTARASASVPLVLAEDGIAKAVIVVPADSTPTEQFAARQMAEYLGKITGGTFEIIEESPGAVPPTEAIISIGRTTLGRDVPVQGPSWMIANREAFRIVCRDNALVICGNSRSDISDQGALWGVHAFLTMQGAGFYLDDPALGKVIPSRPTLTVDRIDVTDAPAFAMRNGANTVAGYLQRYQPGGSNGETDPADEDYLFNRSASEREQEFNHIYQYVITPELRQEHPEWFEGTHNPRYGSQPSPSTDIGYGRSQVGVCLSRPELREHFIEYFRDRFRANPTLYAASIVPDDFSLADRCDCTDCQRLIEAGGPATYPDDGPRSASDLHIDFVNAVAKGLEDDFPDRRLITLAYLDYIDPPRQTRVHPNVIVMIAPLRSADELDPALDQIVHGWRSMGASHLYWYSYLLSRPPVPHLMRQWVRNYQRWGIEGLYFETSGGITALNGLNRWLSSQLMWNPDADVDRLIDEFCVQLFGPEAGIAMRQFFLAWEMNTPLARRDIPRLLDAAEAALGDASSSEAKRFRLFRLGYELYHSGHELDEALKLNDLPQASHIVRSAIKTNRILSSEYPGWGMARNITLLNYVSPAGYSATLLSTIESLVDSQVIDHTPERPAPGPVYCLTDNADVARPTRASTGVAVSYSPSIDADSNGGQLFDGQVEGDEHLVYQHGVISLTIDLDFKRKYQFDSIEICSGMRLMEGGLMQFQTVPLCLEVQVSDDGMAFTTVDRIMPRTLRGYVQSNTLLVTGRYVRLVSTSLNLGHEIDEVRVWGRPVSGVNR